MGALIRTADKFKNSDFPTPRGYEQAVHPPFNYIYIYIYIRAFAGPTAPFSNRAHVCFDFKLHLRWGADDVTEKGLAEEEVRPASANTVLTLLGAHSRRLTEQPADIKFFISNMKHSCASQVTLIHLSTLVTRRLFARDAKSTRMLVKDGAASGHSIPSLHIHVLPR
jgi:hypothetical protein